MAKPSSLWFRESNGFWYTTIHGTQHKLSQDKGEARKKMNGLLAADEPPPPKRAGMTTRKLCDEYLIRTEDQKEPGTHVTQVLHLNAFCKALGHRDPTTLKVHEVEKWLSGQENWAASTRALFITIVKAAFNWGVDQGYFPANPIKKLKRRKTGRRTRLLTPEERAKIKAEVSPRLGDFLELIERTGCRPFSEGAKITAADVDWDKGRSFRHKHKNARKGKTRTIYFPPALLARMKELAAERPEGPLFVNRHGEEFKKGSTNQVLARVCARLGIPPASTYSWRHSYISEALVRGVPVDVLARLVGNTPQVLRDSYSHIEQMDDALAEAAVKAVGG